MYKDIVRRYFDRKCKIRVYTLSLCMGIGLDQLTPYYHTVGIERILRTTIITQKSTNKSIDYRKPNTFSLQKSNYGRRVSSRLK